MDDREQFETEERLTLMRDMALYVATGLIAEFVPDWLEAILPAAERAGTAANLILQAESEIAESDIAEDSELTTWGTGVTNGALRRLVAGEGQLCYRVAVALDDSIPVYPPTSDDKHSYARLSEIVRRVAAGIASVTSESHSRAALVERAFSEHFAGGKPVIPRVPLTP